MGYDISLSARILNWPKLCACCGKRPDTKLNASFTRVKGKRVIRTDTHSWEVPYCSKCVDHVSKANSANTILIIFVLIGIVSIVWSLVAKVYIATVLSAIFMLAGYKFYRYEIEEAESLMSKKCGSLGKAVKFNGWYGTVQYFTFENKDYAGMFANMNSKKVLDKAVL